MSRRMSVSMTLDAVRERRKTVTRRRIDTWRHLREGDRLTLIEKGMGLPKGAKQVVVAEVEVVSITDELIAMVDEEEVRREGFDGMTPMDFINFWLAGHGYPKTVPVDGLPPRPNLGVPCRRIAWRYLDGAASSGSWSPQSPLRTGRSRDPSDHDGCSDHRSTNQRHRQRQHP